MMKKQNLKTRLGVESIKSSAITGVKRGSVSTRVSALSEHLGGMYSLPDEIELRTVHRDKSGISQDGRNIRGYFKKAKSRLM